MIWHNLCALESGRDGQLNLTDSTEMKTITQNSDETVCEGSLGGK